MSQLLVSVRSAAEAEAAVAGGASLIDVKEPAHGSLGRAPDEVLRAVLRAVAGRRPVSAALGEVLDTPAPPAAAVAYAKWGLAGCGAAGEWWQPLARAARDLRRANPGCRLVGVAYADWQRAHAPAPTQLCDFALAGGCDVLLVDTWCKDGTTLCDWLPIPELTTLATRCRAGRVRLALAGSLGPAEIQRLRLLRPDWFAVRGAVCRGRDRTQGVDAAAVRGLVELLADDFTPATPAG